MQAALALQRHADDDTRPAIGGVAGERFQRLLAARGKGGLEHEVLRRIAGEKQLGEDDEIGTLTCRVRPCLARILQVAGDVADNRVELRDGDAEDGSAHDRRWLAQHPDPRNRGSAARDGRVE